MSKKFQTPPFHAGSSENDEERQRAERVTVTSYFQSVASYWKQIYQFDDTFAVIIQDRRAAVLALVDQLMLPRESRILDVGCGAGLIAVALAQRGYVVEAVDVADTMLDLTRRHAAEAGVEERVITSLGDVHHLAFPSEMFSLVITVGVAQWLRSIDQPIQEMARVLNAEGYLIATASQGGLRYMVDPLLCQPLKAVRRSGRELLQRFGLREPPKGPRFHVHSIKDVDASLSAAGLVKLKGMTLGFGPFSFLGFRLLPDSVGVKVHRRLQELADRGLPLLRSAGGQYIVLAKKGASGPAPGSILPEADGRWIVDRDGRRRPLAPQGWDHFPHRR